MDIRSRIARLGEILGHATVYRMYASPDYLRDELILLLELQLSALKKEALGIVTTSEILLYESRQIRIAELYDQLFAKHSASA